MYVSVFVCVGSLSLSLFMEERERGRDRESYECLSIIVKVAILIAPLYLIGLGISETVRIPDRRLHMHYTCRSLSIRTTYT